MTTQLRLIDGGENRPWRLDARSRAAGRKGVAEARKALARARRTPDKPLEPFQRVG